jgi:hypothetical protein
MRFVLVLTAALALSGSTPAGAQDFWAHWGDGKAEVNGYRLTQPRYGAERDGKAVYIFVTEDFSERRRVKAERVDHPKGDVKPVLKLNAVRDFNTGVYDYYVMTSTFLRVKEGWPVSKVSFSSQEWCGHVWHQLIPRDGQLSGIVHSYFDGEEGTDDLETPPDGVFEDALPVLVRDWKGSLVAPGETRTVPFLPSLLQVRMRHRPLAWTTATISRAPGTESITVPAGRFEVSIVTVEVEDGRRLTFAVEAEAPYRLVRQTGADGERLELLGSTRMAYWRLNGPGGEAHLDQIGLGGD